MPSDRNDRTVVIAPPGTSGGIGLDRTMNKPVKPASLHFDYLQIGGRTVRELYERLDAAGVRAI